MMNQNIQIMRAFSLVAVFLFHLEVSYFSFGYLGVDVFFLISGFLMPVILDKYTPFSYIKARIKRLYPALSFLILVSLISGYFVLMPGEYRSLSESAITGLLFSSNYYFLANTGYFDINSKYQFLLHTWTLGNEFLAYLLVFVMWLVFGRKSLLRLSLLFCLATLLYVVLSKGNFNYLDPVPRIYLFFFAFVVSAIYKDSRRLSDLTLVSVAVLSTLFFVYFFGGSVYAQVWPSWAIIVLPVCVLPLLMMRAGIVPNFIKPAILKVGDWSYSIYLWHWFVISVEFVFLRNSAVGSSKEALVLFIPGFALGIFSYYFIERNIRLCYITTFISAVMACFVYMSDGVESRVDDRVKSYSNVHKMVGVDYQEEIEFKGLNLKLLQRGDGQVSTLVVGDSFSQHILPILREASFYRNGTIYRLSLQPDELIDYWVQFSEILNKLRIEEVFISYRLHTKNEDDIVRLSELLRSSTGHSFTIIRDIPSLEMDPVSCYIKKHSVLAFVGCEFDIEAGIPINQVENSESANWSYLKENSTNATLIDTHESMCGSSTCVTVVNGEFIMRDSIHFNEKLLKETNSILAEMIFK